MLGGFGHEGFDRFHGLNAAAGADGSAVERGGGAGEFQLPLQWPALQEPVDESGMKDVTRAGGVHRLNAVGGRVVKALSIPREHSFVAQSCGSEATGVAAMNLRERKAKIAFAGEARGDVAAGNQEIDVGQQSFIAGVEIVEISDDRNSRSARPLGGEGSGGGVVAVQVKDARIQNPFAVEFFRQKGQAGVAFPEHGAFTGLIDEDEGLLAGARWRSEKVRFNAEALEFRAVERCGVVFADLADIARAQAPLLAGGYR